MNVTAEEWRALHDASPCKPDEVIDSWEWGAMDRVLQRIITVRVARAEGEAWGRIQELHEQVRFLDFDYDRLRAAVAAGPADTTR